jgi:hypothetical protein
MNVDLTQALDLFANLGVLGGIVFLAIEIRQNNKQLRAQSRFNYFQTRTELTKELATNLDLGRIAIKKATGEELTPQESHQDYFWTVTILTAWRYEFGEYTQGNLTLQELDLINKRRSIASASLSIREVLATSPESEFTQFVQEQIIDPYNEDPNAYKLGPK